MRIAVNYELMNLDRLMESVADYLEENGMLIAISFHSGEDKIVSRHMRDWV